MTQLSQNGTNLLAGPFWIPGEKLLSAVVAPRHRWYHIYGRRHVPMGLSPPVWLCVGRQWAVTSRVDSLPRKNIKSYGRIVTLRNHTYLYVQYSVGNNTKWLQQTIREFLCDPESYTRHRSTSYLSSSFSSSFNKLTNSVWIESY